MHEVLDVHVKAGRRDAFGALRGLLTFLEQQRQEGEQRVSEERRGRIGFRRMDCLRRISMLTIVWAKKKKIASNTPNCDVVTLSSSTGGNETS